MRTVAGCGEAKRVTENGTVEPACGEKTPTGDMEGANGQPRGRMSRAEFSRVSPVGDVRGYGVFDSRISCVPCSGHTVGVARTMKGSSGRVKM
jgi:hypothetical protein